MSAIVIDTSALVAIFRAEPGSQMIARVLSESSSIVLPAPCLVEAALLRHIARGFFDWVNERFNDPRFVLGDISAETARIAAEAAHRYGKGAGHRAQLNFGDCLSYAVARSRDLPLLYVGDDFRHTDVRSATD